MSFRHAYFAGTAHGIIMYDFDDAATSADWTNEVSLIKNEMARINEIKNPPDSLVRDWLQQVATFQNKWGGAKVPPDVQEAVHGVQEYLKVPLTTF